jgi:perosamine synthetase
MMNSDQKATADHFRNSVAVWQDPERCIPFIKGRVALYAILKTLGVGPGDEVLVPGFTCVVVPAAIMYTGALPVYYDIDPATLHGSPILAAHSITDRTKAVLIQHNFGAVAPLGDLPQVCRSRGIALIEDCAHSLGAISDRGPVGTLGTAAFCSLQWSKPTTTGLGGIARVNDESMITPLRDFATGACSEPSLAKSAYLGTLSLLYRKLYRPKWYWVMRDSYRLAAKRGIIQGSSSARELEICDRPPDYCERFGRPRRRSLESVLNELPNSIPRRRNIHSRYAAHFAKTPTWTPANEPDGTAGVALRYPLLVENRAELLRCAREEKIEIGDWFNAPLHPHGARADAFGFQPSVCPIGTAAADKVINLPTHAFVTYREADRIMNFISAVAVLTGRDEWESGPRLRASSTRQHFGV